MERGNWVKEVIGRGIGGGSGSGMGRNRKDDQVAMRMNGNLQLVKAGSSQGHARDLE